ncbi:MAG: acyl carrier protein [Leptolinea sp.]|jgi:acyl carrier protein|nr:acyl carrier protein [Leptolinea sp.]
MSDSTASVLSARISERILKQPDRVIKPDEPLISSGLIDSFSLVDLAIIVEDEFGVRIDDSELNADTFDTLDALVKLIESRK